MRLINRRRTGGELPGGYWHWQNLDEDRNGKEKGKGWRHGRAWFNFRTDREEGRDHRSIQLSTEWVIRFRRHAPFSLSFDAGQGDSDNEIGGHLGIFGTTLYLGLDAPIIRSLCRRIPRNFAYDRGRTISLSVHDNSVWWRMWASPNSWEFKTPKWRDGSFDVADWVLGKPKHASEIVEIRDPAIIPMPEGPYQGAATLKLETWTRQRFGWPQRRLYRVHIDIPDGIPEPGKGENAWDCGDDATFGITAPASSIEEGIAKLVESVLTRRRRYGGYDWRPPVTPAGERVA